MAQQLIFKSIWIGQESEGLESLVDSPLMAYIFWNWGKSNNRLLERFTYEQLEEKIKNNCLNNAVYKRAKKKLAKYL